MIVHGTFQHLEPLVSTPSKSHVTSTASHSASGSGQVDRSWRPLAAVKPANDFDVARAPIKRQNK